MLWKLCWSDIFAIFFCIFFRPNFNPYVLWSLWTDWLQILWGASWGGSLLKLWKLCWLNIFCNFFHFFSPNWPINFKFYVRHSGEGLYQSYRNYAIHQFFHFCQFFLHFFVPIFKHYLLWSLWTDWLQISCEAFWGGSLLKLLKLCQIYGNYADVVILSAECQGPWASS